MSGFVFATVGIIGAFTLAVTMYNKISKNAELQREMKANNMTQTNRKDTSDS